MSRVFIRISSPWATLVLKEDPSYELYMYQSRSDEDGMPDKMLFYACVKKTKNIMELCEEYMIQDLPAEHIYEYLNKKKLTRLKRMKTNKHKIFYYVQKK